MNTQCCLVLLSFSLPLLSMTQYVLHLWSAWSLSWSLYVILFVEEQRTEIYSNTSKYIGFLTEVTDLNIAPSLMQYFSVLPLPALPLRCFPAGNTWKIPRPAVHPWVAGNNLALPTFSSLQRVFRWLGPGLPLQSSCQSSLSASSLGRSTWHQGRAQLCVSPVGLLPGRAQEQGSPRPLSPRAKHRQLGTAAQGLCRLGQPQRNETPEAPQSVRQWFPHL